MRCETVAIFVAAAVAVLPHCGAAEEARAAKHPAKKARAAAATPTVARILWPPTPTEGPEELKKPKEVTEVFGDLPDSMAGTWLIISELEIGVRYRNTWSAYRMSRSDSKWQYNLLTGKPTQPLLDALADANKQNRPAELDAATLEAAKAMNATLAQPRHRNREDKIFLRDAKHLAPNTSLPPAAQDTKYVLEFLTQEGPNVKASGISYYITEVSPDKMSGFTQIATVAIAGPAVVPLAFGGRFVMYRLQ